VSAINNVELFIYYKWVSIVFLSVSASLWLSFIFHISSCYILLIDKNSQQILTNAEGKVSNPR